MKEDEALSIRVGKHMFSDVKDYVLIIRDKDNAIISRSSSSCWSYGAMDMMLNRIAHDNAQFEDDDEK